MRAAQSKSNSGLGKARSMGNLSARFFGSTGIASRSGSDLPHQLGPTQFAERKQSTPDTARDPVDASSSDSNTKATADQLSPPTLMVTDVKTESPRSSSPLDWRKSTFGTNQSTLIGTEAPRILRAERVDASGRIRDMEESDFEALQLPVEEVRFAPY